jgi:hypothetical protein
MANRAAPIAGRSPIGARRLGRSGLATRPPLVTAQPQTDNVWDVDCAGFFPSNVGGMDIHGPYFATDATIELMRQVLRGIHRGVLTSALKLNNT